jgi:branched-chain amino acid transport system permease protein
VNELLGYVLAGLASGGTYAVVGLGMSLIYQVTGIVNFAQGDFVMVGGLTYAVAVEGGIHAVPAAVVALAVAGGCGALMHLAVLTPARNAGHDRLIVLTIGASFLLQGLALLAFGADQHFAKPFSGDRQIHVAGATVSMQYLWCLVAAAAAAGLVWAVLYRSAWGRAMRATAADRQAARLMGIPPLRMGLIALVLAALLAGLAGIVLAPVQPPDATVGVALGLKGFAAAVLGGLGSPMGAITGGLVVGVAEAVLTGVVSSGYRDVFVYGALVLALLARPGGLLRRTTVERV